MHSSIQRRVLRKSWLHRSRAKQRKLRLESLENRVVLSTMMGTDSRDVSPPVAVENEYLISYQAGLSDYVISEVTDQFSYSELQTFDTSHPGIEGDLQLISVSDEEAGSLISRLSDDPRVKYIEPNYTVTTQLVPNDPDFDELWGLNNTGQTGGTSGSDIRAIEAWNFSAGSTGVVVGVVDTGVDYTHPDLYLNIWLNQGEIPEQGGRRPSDVDQDGVVTFYDLNEPANEEFVTDINANGYIDAGDLLADPLWANGLDGSDPGSFVDDLIGWDFANDDNDPFDDQGHGTHVSGTIGAIGDNDTGITGVNWRTQIMPLKFLSAGGAGTTADAIQAIQYATQLEAQLTNNSWGGGGFSSALQNAIAASGDANLLFVAAAGNDGQDTDFVGHYPSSYQLGNIISVAATDHHDDLATFSNFGATSVDLAAPGVTVFSTTPNGTYSTFNGTSMASPHVAGVAALAWSLQPDATVQEIRTAILEGVDEVAGVGGSVATGGRLNALTTLQNVNPNSGTILFSQEAYRFPGAATITVFDTDPDIDPNSPDTLTVQLTSTTESVAETVTLTETGASTRQFSGTIALVAGDAVSEDGQLQVAHGDEITATYLDADPGEGPAVISTTALIDTVAPVLDTVRAVPGARQATILWRTDEQTDSLVRFGSSPNNLDQIVTDSKPTTLHSVSLFGLQAETTYFYEVVSADAAGNRATSGVETFVTQTAPPILFVDDDQGATLDSFFIDALNEGGYIYGVWDVNELGEAPDVFELSDHATVIWNTGANYDAPAAGLSPTEEASLRGYLDGGGNLFLIGQDILFNGVSQAFLTDYLHISAFIEDVTLDRAFGAPGDPIGDGVSLSLELPGAFEPDFIDKLLPDSEAAGSLFSDDADSGPSDIAIRYPAEGPSTFKTVFFSFPFESISVSAEDPNNQVAIMDRVLTWLGNDAPGRPGVVIEPRIGIETSERGASDSFTLNLKTEPTADVTLELVSGDTTEGLLAIGEAAPTDLVTVTFTPENWEVPQTVTVVGLDDELPDGDLTYVVVTNPTTSEDPLYQGFDPIDVAVTNLEDAPFVQQGIVEGVGSDDWTRVQLDRSFESMVVVATPNYDRDSAAGVVRVRNATGNGFEVRVDSPTGETISGLNVHYVAMEEGSYSLAEHGVNMEARTFTSTQTDGPGDANGDNPDVAWVGESQEYLNSYEQPVVLGQVMSYNDPRWSVFWSRSDTSFSDAPDTTLRIGKHVGEDPEISRADELLGYIVLEAGTGSLGGVTYVAGLGTESVAGVGDVAPYTYGLSGLSSAGTAVVSQAGMNGWNGGWAILYGDDAVTSTSLNLAIDEDQFDEERSHTWEQVGYLVFEREPNAPPVIDLDGDDSSGVGGGNYTTTLRSKETLVAAVDSDALLIDTSSDHLFSLIATITNLRDGEAEFLVADTTGTDISASYNSETGELSLTGIDSPANYQQVLRSVVYENNAEDRSPVSRAVSFVASDGALRSNIATTTIVFPPPNQRPVPNPGGPYAISVGGSVLLNASQSVDPDIGPSPLTFEWDLNYSEGEFDANATGRTAAVNWGQLQQFGVTAGSTHTIAVRAFDGEDATIATTTLTVAADQPPIVITGGPYSIQPGWTLLLNSTGSFDPERGPSVLTLEWDINYDGDFETDVTGRTAAIGWARLQQFGVKPGKVTPIALRASDGTNVTTATTHVTVGTNRPPAASTDGPYAIQPGWTVFMRATGSHDPDFGPELLTYEWDIDFDGEFESDATGSIITLNWPRLQQLGVEAGKSHRVALRVYDGADESMTFTTLTVTGTAATSLASPPLTTLLGTPALATPAPSSAPAGDSDDSIGFVDPGIVDSIADPDRAASTAATDRAIRDLTGPLVDLLDALRSL